MDKKIKIVECTEISDRLTLVFPSFKIWTDGRVYQVKELIEQERSFKFYIYPNDHNPPHFHVRSSDGEIDASFDLESCDNLSGKIKNPNDLKKIKFFWETHANMIKKKWDELRELTT